MKNRKMFTLCHLAIAGLCISYRASAQKETILQATPDRINRWYTNCYSLASEGEGKISLKNKYSQDSSSLVSLKPTLKLVGKPVYVYDGNGHDQVAWLDRDGRFLGKTTTSTYYANLHPHQSVHRDSYNPWGATSVESALLVGGLNYALNGFRNPDYRTQKFYIQPSLFPSPGLFR